MRAMVCRGPYEVRVEEKGGPGIEHPGDAVVRVTTAAIRGSDPHLVLRGGRAALRRRRADGAR